MIRPLLLCFVLALLAVAPNAFADQTGLVGKYQIEGWDPGNNTAPEPNYHGKAELRVWGEALSYRGTFDGMTYAGAGIYDAETRTLSLSFTNVEGTERGVTLLKLVGDQLEGKWVLDNGRNGETGKEIWTRE